MPGSGWFFRCCALLCLLAAAGASRATAALAADQTEARRYLGYGADAYRMGDAVEATRLWGEAIRFCRLAGDTATEVDALARRGEALQSTGQLRAAAGDLELALHRAETLGDTARLAAVTGALGNLYFQAHDPTRARPLLERSLALARQVGSARISAASANNLGNVALTAGDAPSALRAYAQGIKSAKAAGDAALRVTATTNLARALFREGREADALDTLQVALTDAAGLPGSVDTAYALIAIGRLAEPARDAIGSPLAGKRQALAYEALRRSGQLADRLHDARTRSLSYGYLGELYESAGRRPDARALAQRAIYLAQQANANDLLYRWDWLSGRLARAAGDRMAAIGAYRRAVAALETIRQDIPVDYIDGRSSFRETMGPLYLQLADLLLQAAADPANGAHLPALLREARNAVEDQKTAEVRDYFKEQCLVPLEARTVAAVNASESSGTATLYPIILPDRVELLLAFSGDPERRVTVPVSEAVLTSKTQELRADLETLGTREYLGPAQQLYDWLIRPLEPDLARHHVDTLIVVPDGVLRTIPFAALHDGTSFLVTHYAVATELGLTLMDPKPIARQRLHALLTGLSQPAQGFPALPFVPDELDKLRHIASDSTVLENESFRLGRVEQALRTVPYSVVHIASHAEFSHDPTQTYILAYDGRLTLNALEDTIKYGAFRDQPLELLTLSACRTAAGDDRAALGLAGVAIKAGARSAVASLWFINDEAASSLVTQFYARLNEPNVSKAKALQGAQLEMIKGHRFRHPGYWSPFLVIGNWL